MLSFSRFVFIILCIQADLLLNDELLDTDQADLFLND